MTTRLDDRWYYRRYRDQPHQFQHVVEDGHGRIVCYVSGPRDGYRIVKDHMIRLDPDQPTTTTDEQS